MNPTHLIHIDPVVATFVLVNFIILVVGIALSKTKQSYITGYLLTGILIGPYVFGLIQDPVTLARIGSLGVIFLLFFIGMEISPRQLTGNWKISIIGTLLKTLISLVLVYFLGQMLAWSYQKIIVLGFVISLSSTAVVLKLLEDWNEIGTRVGQNVIGILLVQDLLIVPMMIILNMLGGALPSTQSILLQVFGAIVIIAILTWISAYEKISLPWIEHLSKDHEMQVFAALGICFGLALFTGLMELSTGLGAFIGGMVVSSAKETSWVKERLSALRTIFIALFFVSIGTLINTELLINNIFEISFLVTLVIFTNTAVTALILRALGEEPQSCLYGGSLLSQIVEFSFLIVTVGYQSSLITYATYQNTITVIAVSLVISPFWILLIRKLTRRSHQE